MNIGKFGPAYILALHAQPLKWHVALGELCDNSFDAGASRVDITFGPSRNLTVEDDGIGCDDVERMLTLGRHHRHSTTKLGRWGVGLKEAAIWLWGELTIDMVHKGNRHNAIIDWQRLSKQEEWDTPDPTVTTTSAASGTRLRFRNISKGFPDYDALRDELGYVFAPALWFGKQILLRFPKRKPITCGAWQMPDVTDVVQDRFEISGKRVHLRAGIVPVDVVNQRPGFSISHCHRIIMNTAFGSRGNSVSRICGIIELDAGWILSKNKTELVDSDRDALELAIFERCKGILEQSAQQAVMLRNSALETSVSESLRGLLIQQQQKNDSKEKRQSPENATGTVKPTNSGKKRRNAKNRQPGDSMFGKCDVSQIRMEWKARADGQLGKVDLPGNVIYLNSEHKRLQHHRDGGNADALVDNCMTLLSFEAIESEQKERLPFIREYDGFIDALSHVLESQINASESSHVPAETTA